MLDLPGEYLVSRCEQCGLLFQNPQVDASALPRHYPDDYQPFEARAMDLNRTARWFLRNRYGYSHLPEAGRLGVLKQRWGRWTAHLHLVPRFVPNGRVLEIGCASGARLNLFRSLGWMHCSGIEMSPHAAALARRSGLDVRAGRIEDVLEDLPLQDAIVSGFVMEHLEDPYATTRRIAGKLPAGGQFIFSTINVESLDFRLYRDFWVDLDLPRHFTFFRESDLRRMLAPELEIIEICHGPSATDFLASAGYRAKERATFVDRLLLALGERTVTRLSVLLALLGQTSRICVHTRKR
jgi:2-polyprenyl-3-methyl-5-hydroxy-6-metoxy-1,4-benzoquinol methylase